MNLTCIAVHRRINNGRLIFNGSPKLVGIDVRATRTINKQVVGIHLGGNILNPQSKIFSDPQIEDSEALSYLLTGNSLSSASGQQSALLLSAVRGLGITGNGSMIQKIGASFGLDDVNIVTGSDLQSSELALGKRLGSRLYVRYLIGLFDQTQKIVVEYKINDVLSLEAQTTADDFGLDFANPDFVKYAQSYGVRGHRINVANKFTKTLADCLAQPGIDVIEVPIDYSENNRVLDEELKHKTCLL